MGRAMFRCVFVERTALLCQHIQYDSERRARWEDSRLRLPVGWRSRSYVIGRRINQLLLRRQLDVLLRVEELTFRPFAMVVSAELGRDNSRLRRDTWSVRSPTRAHLSVYGSDPRAHAVLSVSLAPASTTSCGRSITCVDRMTDQALVPRGQLSQTL